MEPVTLLQTGLGETENEEILLISPCFSDKTKLELNGLVKRCNSKIWGGESHCEIIEYQSDTYVNSWCGAINRTVEPLLFGSVRRRGH